jgi:hypothetical protein
VGKNRYRPYYGASLKYRKRGLTGLNPKLYSTYNTVVLWGSQIVRTTRLRVFDLTIPVRLERDRAGMMLLPSAEGRESGAGGEKDGRAMDESTQNMQYDQIGTRYLEIKTLPAVEPELPSILDSLGDRVRGTKCLGMSRPSSHQ